MQNAFRDETGPDGQQWAPLAESTIESRAGRIKSKKTKKKIKKTGGTKILVDSGRLKNSMFARAKGNAIEFGSNVAYLAPHQLGTDRAGKKHNVKIPRRIIAPVVKRGGFWTLVDSGPAKAVFFKIMTDLKRFISQ